MKQYANYVFLALLLGGAGSSSTNLYAAAVAPTEGKKEEVKQKENKKEKSGWQEYFVNNGVALAAGAGTGLSLYHVPSVAVPYVAAGAAVTLGIKLLEKIRESKGIRRLWSDANTIAENDGLNGLWKAGGKAAAAGIGEGMKENLVDPTGKQIKNWMDENFKPIAFTVLGVGAGLIGLWYGAKILNNYFEKHINKPRLDVIIKKASSQGMLGTLTRQIVVDDPTRIRFNLFLHTNFKVKQSIISGNEDARFRTALLWGPSGCGKRMFAQEMAHFAGMDYYEIPWSSFQKFKEADASRAIEEFFKREVTKSTNGAVIYIDNAQMLFTPMLSTGATPSPYALIRSALIENIEGRSSRFSVIFGMTGKPVLAQDTALMIDDIIEVSLPKVAERKRLLKTYRDLYFMTPNISEETQQAVQRMLDDQTLENIAKRLDKASASELASFMSTLKIEATLPTSEGLTPSLVSQLIARAEHRFEEAIA